MYEFHYDHDYTFLTEMMLQVDQNKRADIYQVSSYAFELIGKPCPVRNVHVS